MTKKVVITLTFDTDGDPEVAKMMLDGYLNETAGEHWLADVLDYEAISPYDPETDTGDIGISLATHTAETLETPARRGCPGD